MTALDEDRGMLAAELALRLLDGRDLDEARALAERDADFASEVAAWDARFAPLFDEIAPVEPDSAVWRRIEAAIGRVAANDDGEVIALRRKLAGWRNVAGLMTAIAAALALVVVPNIIRPDAAPPTAPAAPARQPMLMAKMVAEDRSTAFVIAYQPGQSELVVTPAIATVPDDRDLELWLIGASGVPVSMGVFDESKPTTLAVAPVLIAELAVSPTMAVTIEPNGGSPTGKPTSTPIATGPLVKI